MTTEKPEPQGKSEHAELMDAYTFLDNHMRSNTVHREMFVAGKFPPLVADILVEYAAHACEERDKEIARLIEACNENGDKMEYWLNQAETAEAELATTQGGLKLALSGLRAMTEEVIKLREKVIKYEGTR